MRSTLLFAPLLFSCLISCTSHIEDQLMNPPSNGLEKDKRGDLSDTQIDQQNHSESIPAPEPLSDNDETPVIRFVTDTEFWLQGKWQHEDDKTNYLIFDGEHRKEIAGTSTTWDDQIFVLSNKCMNDMDADNGMSSDNDEYISCKKSDLCWYIVEITKKRLELSYMGRGNSLIYNKVR